MSEIASFRVKLKCLAQYLDHPDVIEIAINKPKEVWLATQGERYMRLIKVPELTVDVLDALADVTASFSKQAISKETPVLSATIPVDLSPGLEDSERGGYRVQIIIPPAVPEGDFGFCIRKPTLIKRTLEMYESDGALEDVNMPVQDNIYSDEVIFEHFQRKEWLKFLRAAVKGHKNIVVSAGTGAGKTTLLNTLAQEIQLEERLCTIEDTREVQPPQKNCLYLLYSRGRQGVAQVSPISLLEACLRLTPDRIVMGELRGAEAFSYLELLNTGHEGSITTIHADSPKKMFERLCMMVMRAEGASTLTKSDIIDYAKSLIHIVIQFKRASTGRRYVSEIEFMHDGKLVSSDMALPVSG